MKITIELKEHSITILHMIAEETSLKEALSVLAEDKNFIVRRAVAENYNTPAEILAKLAEDEFPDIRIAVAENANTSIETLTKLAEDVFHAVRQEVAYNENTPIEILIKLVEDEDINVKKAAKEQIKNRTL